jgi:RNA polymerase sigma-70 factor (ECF subfamily)
VINQTHEVVSVGPERDLWAGMRPPGRIIHRGTRAKGEEEDGDRGEILLVWAPTHPLRIFHFPVRSFEQFRKRTEIFLRHGGWRDTGRFRRLRYHYEQGRLDELYAELAWDDSQVEESIRDGELVRDEDEARDLLQDVFVRAWERLESFRGQSAFGTWLHRLAVNVVLEHLRSSRRDASRQVSADDEEIFGSRSNAGDLDTRMDVATALDALPAGARIVFVLHDMEG